VSLVLGKKTPDALVLCVNYCWQLPHKRDDELSERTAALRYRKSGTGKARKFVPKIR
jgi:hypothetical protein